MQHGPFFDHLVFANEKAWTPPRVDLGIDDECIFFQVYE